jgi:hypothetical protein
MKKFTAIILLVTTYLFVSCEKDYKNEVFNDKYKNVYGNWRFEKYVGMIVPQKESDYIIEFIPFGKFSYNGNKAGNIKILEQTELSLMVDFNDLFPKTGNSYLWLLGQDTLVIYPVGADMSGRQFTRINK